MIFEFETYLVLFELAYLPSIDALCAIY